MAQTMPTTPTARTHCTPARLQIERFVGTKSFWHEIMTLHAMARSTIAHTQAHTPTLCASEAIKYVWGMWQAPLPPSCLPSQLGSGTKLIWRRDKSRWLAQHDSQVMINEHTLHAHTTAHSHTWLLVSCIRCVYVIYSSECVYRIIDIFISPPFRHKANLLIRAICSTCPQLVRPPPPLSLSSFPSLSLHTLLPLFTSCGFSTWHKFCGVNYEA